MNDELSGNKLNKIKKKKIIIIIIPIKIGKIITMHEKYHLEIVEIWRNFDINNFEPNLKLLDAICGSINFIKATRHNTH